MKIVQIICQDVQERLFWTKNLRFMAHSALGLAAGMVLVGFVERKLDDSALKRVVVAVCVSAVAVFVYRSYRAFRERLRGDFAGQLERLNPEFEDRFATLAHLEGMTLDADQKRIYEAIAVQVAPKVKTMRRGATSEQVLLPLLIACVFLIPASLLFPGTRDAIWRLMKQLDRVVKVRAPKTLKSSDLIKERSARRSLGEVRITKPDEKVSMSLYETAEVVALVRTSGEAAEVRASFWKNGSSLAPKRLEWPMSQREGEVNFTIFPEDYGLDLLDVLAYQVEALIRADGKENWLRSKVHVIEISPFAEERERLKKEAKNRDLRVLDDLSTVIREQARLAAELQKAAEDNREKNAKRSESHGKKPDGKKASENQQEMREQEMAHQQRMKETSRMQLEAAERAGKSCPNGSKAGRRAADAMAQAANGCSAIAAGNMEEAARWQTEALHSLSEARKEMIETIKSEAERASASRLSGRSQKTASENNQEKQGLERSDRESSKTANGSANGPNRQGGSAVSSGSERTGEGEKKREGDDPRDRADGSAGGGKRESERSGASVIGRGGEGAVRPGEWDRRRTIRHPEQEARAAINDYLNRPEQELLNPPVKPSVSSSNASSSGWQSAAERELQDAINSAKADSKKDRDRVSQRNKEMRKERLEEALQEVERYLEVLERSEGPEKAQALRAMLPEEDRRELEKQQRLPARSAVPFHERDVAESARRVSESIAKRIEAGRGLSPQQLEALMKESPLSDAPEKALDASETAREPSTNSTRQTGSGSAGIVDRSTTEGKVDKNQVEVSTGVKVKKAGEDEGAEVDRVPVSFRSRVERYFRKLATE